MEPNGGNGVGQQQQQAPVQQQAPAPQQQVQYVPAQNGMPVLPPPQAPAQQQQVDGIAQMRQNIAANLGVSIDQVPSDPGKLAQVVAAGWAATNELTQYRNAQPQNQPVPSYAQPQAPQGQQGPSLTQEKQMPANWQSLVQKDDKGVYHPVHPSLSQVAADANHNEGVRLASAAAVSSGQVAPQTVEEIRKIVEQEFQQKHAAQQEQAFMDANEKKLYQFDANGNKMSHINVATGKAEPLFSEFGEMVKAEAENLARRGIQYPNRYEMAKHAMELAEAKQKYQQQVQTQGPPGQVYQKPHSDLDSLFNGHKNAGIGGGPNINTNGNPNLLDTRFALQNRLANVPDSGVNSMDYVKALLGR